MTAALSFASMMRPSLGALTAAGAMASLAIAAPGAPITLYPLLGLAVFLTTAGGFVINDFVDRERDRVTHPERPLPGGLLPPWVALVGGTLCFAASLAASLALGPDAALVVGCNILLLAAYSAIKVWHGVAGNLLTAYLCASIALLGGVVGDGLPRLLPAVVFLFLAVAAREAVLDLNDADGDRQAGLRTIAILGGPRAVFLIAWEILAALAVYFLALSAHPHTAGQSPSLLFILATLGLFGIGLWSYQSQRTPVGFGRFLLLTRWSFALAILAFLVPSPVRAAAAEQGPRFVLDQFEGAFAFGLAGIGFTLFLFANQLLTDYNREPATPASRIDDRWRFYAVFSCLMYTVFFQCIAYAIHPYSQGGFFASLGNPLEIFLFATGFVPLPVIWLELAWRRNSNRIGFTRLYERSCREVFANLLDPYFDEQADFRRIEKATISGYSRFYWRFTRTWLFIYALTPAWGFHLWRNWRNYDVDSRAVRWLQAGQDLLVMATIWLFASSFAVSIVWGLFPQTEDFFLGGLPFVRLGLLSLLVAAFSLATFGQFRGDYRSGIEIFPSLSLGLYSVALMSDVFQADRSLAWTRPIQALAGGWAPWALLVLLIYLLVQFMEQLAEARRRGFGSAQVADFALHRFGNLLVAPSLTLDLIEKELKTDEAIQRLRDDETRRGIVRGQINTAQGAVTTAQDILRDLKSRSRKARNEVWLPVAPLLEEFSAGSELGRPADDIEIRLMTTLPFEVEILTDRTEFADVLRNLIENARDAIKEHSVRHPNFEGLIELDASYDSESFFPLTLWIRDNGGGIRKEIEKRIFQANFTTKQKGSGLGLFVAKEAIEAMGGEIRPVTDHKTYAEFIIRIPSARVRRRNLRVIGAKAQSERR